MNSRKRFSQALVQQDRFPTDEEWAADYDALAAENAELRRCLDGGFDCAGERMRLAAELAEVKADRQAIWTAASKREARREALEAALETISNGEGAGGLAETERLQEIARAARTPSETPAKPRGRCCTCDNCLGSSTSCRVDAGERLGELWYCEKRFRASRADRGEKR